MNFPDFDSAITKAKAYKIPCVICKLLKPDTPIKRRNPFFIMRIERFDSSILNKASIEGCTVPLEGEVYKPSKMAEDIFRR